MNFSNYDSAQDCGGPAPTPPGDVLVYPRAELRFEPADDVGWESSCRIALVNPSGSPVTYKLKSNAEKVGLRLMAHPPTGIVDPGGSREVLVALLGGAAGSPPRRGSLADLKVILETAPRWGPGARRLLPTRTRLPCLPGWAAAAENDSVTYGEGLQTRTRPPCRPEARCYAPPPRLPLPSPPPPPFPPPAVSFGGPPPPPLPVRVLEAADGDVPDVPHVPDAAVGGGEEAESKVIPYLVSLLVWVGLGVSLGQGLFCNCE